jgi:predicted methyltransferase
MYEQSMLSELIRFARVDAGSVVIDVYPGDGDWTRLLSDVVGGGPKDGSTVSCRPK